NEKPPRGWSPHDGVGIRNGGFTMPKDILPYLPMADEDAAVEAFARGWETAAHACGNRAAHYHPPLPGFYADYQAGVQTAYTLAYQGNVKATARRRRALRKAGR